MALRICFRWMYSRFFYLKMASSIMRIKTIAATIFSTFICLLCFPSTVLSEISLGKIQLPPNATGPEALAFELGNGVFYTGIADGRILKYQGRSTGFVDFGFTAPKRLLIFCISSKTILILFFFMGQRSCFCMLVICSNSNCRSKLECDGTDTANPNPACGRPLGMALHHATQKLYVCDAFFGFGVLGPQGGLATQLSTSADGEPYRFCNAVDVHQLTGNVYFTDASAVYGIRQIAEAARVKDSTGRLLKYDPKTKKVTVLFRNLSGAAGVAVDEEEEFALVSEFFMNRTRKIWLQGPKANKSDIINSQPMPDNIKRTTLRYNFWLAAAMVKQRTQAIVPIGQRINAFGNGTVLQTVNLERWYGNKSVSEVQEYGGHLYVVSRLVDFVLVIPSFVV
ncbi:protein STRICTOSIDINE SYNTHASE-LIKE 12-like isoform X1 [Durio zibethinus]|uniref:Protein STRICTOSIDINE SYNTHASE-LIKE 12-like isoform X1 n=1 Tax=Durio zibethinus TaxID=66656 RepID=A0A6P5YD58_DURZI|nr:protein STRICTOSIDINE SYNTHASE-LIKE 12-like isoform X1 [Durio zibethinus]